jgi:RNA polymerase-binding protein DksA
MNTIKTGQHRDRLQKRRDQVVMTLDYLGKEQEEVEQNSDWLDQAAFASRVNLLDRLTGWYATEMDQIDRALERMDRNKFGRCLACHNPIEEERLDSQPTSEFCIGCQEVREEL